MKVCFYNVTTTVLVGGLETYCREVASHLAALGCRVDVLGGQPPGGTPSEIPGVRVVTFPFFPEKRVPIGGTRGGRLVERISFARHAAPFFMKQGYDVVVIAKPFDFPVMHYFKRIKPFPVVYCAQGREFYFGDRLFSKSIDYFISTSRYTARQVEGRYGRPVEVVHNGVDIKKFSPVSKDRSNRADLGIGKGPVVVTVGRLVGWKGLQVLFESLPSIKSAIPGVQVLVIGDGPYRGELEKQAESLGIENDVFFAGRIPHEQLSRYLSLADVMVQPSIGEEAFGITLAEAMACGVPAVGARIGGIPEVIVDGKSGLIVPPRDEKALSEAIVTLLQNYRLRREMGVNARRLVVERFTWSANAERHLEIFKMLLGKRPKGASVGCSDLKL